MLLKLSRRTILLSLVVGLLLVSVSVALAVDPEEDGRINAWATLGGRAIYCVDANMNPVAHWTAGGIRVLAMDGSELLFVSSARIAEVGVPSQNTQLESDHGVTLYRLVGGGFQLDGLDEHGDPFQFIFYSCLPITPIPNAYVDEDPPLPK